MKKILNAFLIFLTIGGFASCSEDFLETEPTEFISSEQILEVAPYNPTIFDGSVLGLYTLMYDLYTGGTDGHDDFGQKGYDILTDMLSGGMAMASTDYNWYVSFSKLSATVDYTSDYNYMPWRYYYKIIRSANTIIDQLGGNDAVPTDAVLMASLGQAKAMRAHSYYNLATMYATEFDLNADILPLYITPSDSAVGLSSGSVIWNQIKSDLEDAVMLLDGFSREGKFQIDKSVAQGLLAYTYQTMGLYTEAAATANDVIIDYGYKMLEMDEVLTTGFSDVISDSWIWGMDLTLDQGLDLVSWWGQMDVFTYSYAAVGNTKVIDAGLYASIDTTDIRAQWFGGHPWYGYAGTPINKFYHSARVMMGQREVTTDYVYMRVEEMYLLKAEAEAFDNKDVDAQNTLFALVSRRDTFPNYVKTLTGQDLKDEIYRQWKVEMWGEGKSFTAMKRNKLDVVREGHLNLNGIAIPFNDDRLTFDIPYQEIKDNPYINK